jgi:pimeloyl-ACP methyl ester carboxylesterase
MNYRSLCPVIFSLVMAVITTACAPTPAISTPPLLPTPLDEKVDVGGYKLRIICTGQGTPTVIIDAAFGDPALESGNWINVRYGIEKTTRICLYDRAGLGSSNAAPAPTRTSQDMVTDLHALLVNAKVAGPYVLVGHEMGGFNVRLYASQYLDEVVGLVLVDAIHPDYESETQAVLPPESPGEPDILKLIRTYGFFPDPSDNPERMDFIASAAQVRATRSLGDLPLVVLTSANNSFYLDIPPDVDAKMNQVWQDLQIDLAKLSSNSTHVMAREDGSYNYIPLQEPQLVIDAILKVIDEAEKSARQ